jgi:tRNA dimethylallyltransferase
MSENTLIVILGPTATGKTDLAIEIAHRLVTEIISSDSRQIYKEIRIGTSRPSEKQLSLVKHHFIASHSIYDYYNASMFEFEVIDLLHGLFKKHKNVVMTGGSGLYIEAVCNGIDDLPAVEPEIRTKLLNRLKTEGINKLQQELLQIDPFYFKTADIENPKRILKALEVFYMTGKPYSQFLTKPKKDRNFRIIKIGLSINRQDLYKVIDNRVDMMIKNGLEGEARSVSHARHLNALNTVGYKEFFEYFDGKISYEKAVELIKRNSRHYAKRQITWFSGDKDITWFHPAKRELIWEYLNKILK